jgi:hypothetical protein
VNRRGALTGLRDGGSASARGGNARRGRPPGKQPDWHIELDPADHEEPTWEVHRPGTPRRRFDRRARMILAAAAIAAVLANAGAAWAYWHWNAPDEPERAAGTVFELALIGSTGVEQRLRPGEIGDLTVTVTNQHPVPIRITTLKPGAGPAVADDAHQQAGCENPQVEIVRGIFPVSWEVPRNTIGAFVLEDAVTLRATGPVACRGATFSVPVRAQAERP